MKTEQQQEGLVTVLALSGPLVEEELDEFAATLQDLIAKGRRQLLLDLSDVPFVDSKAMELLLDTSAELNGPRGTLKIGGVSDIVAEAFDATRLSRSIEVFRERGTARRRFA